MNRIYTVFPLDESEAPQDFETFAEAKKYGDELEGGYHIAETNGEIV